MTAGFNSHQRGFSLLSLMTGLVIVGILMTIAVPSYRNHIAKARRDTAQSALLVLAQHMHTTYSKIGSFMPDGSAPDLPFTTAPMNSTKVYYDLRLSDVAGQSFVLRAEPKAAQAEDGFLEITHTGQQRWDSNNSGSIEAGERRW